MPAILAIGATGIFLWLLWSKYRETQEANGAAGSDGAGTGAAAAEPPPGVDGPEYSAAPRGTLPGPGLDLGKIVQQTAMIVDRPSAMDYATAPQGQPALATASNQLAAQWVSRLFGKPAITGAITYGGGALVSQSQGVPTAEPPPPARPAFVTGSLAVQRYVPPWIE